MAEPYSIKLPLFEGPLDLLLHLIKEQKIDIYDIPISLITRQYLEYIEMMKELNLEIAGDFLVMAATLIHIKSRMLLPVEETADTEEPEDPRLELVMKLLEYQAFKDAAFDLKEREDEWSGVFSREPSGDDAPAEDGAEPALFELNIFDLITSFKRMLDRAPVEVQAITRETLTIKDKMTVIIEVLQSKEALRFEEMFKDDMTRSHLIVTFIALLELIRLGLAKAYQEKEFGTVWVINPEAQPDISQIQLDDESISDRYTSPAPAHHSPFPSEKKKGVHAAMKLPENRRLPENLGKSVGHSLPENKTRVPKKRNPF